MRRLSIDLWSCSLARRNDSSASFTVASRSILRSSTATFTGTKAIKHQSSSSSTDDSTLHFPKMYMFISTDQWWSSWDLNEFEHDLTAANSSHFWTQMRKLNSTNWVVIRYFPPYLGTLLKKTQLIVLIHMICSCIQPSSSTTSASFQPCFWILPLASAGFPLPTTVWKKWVKNFKKTEKANTYVYIRVLTKFKLDPNSQLLCLLSCISWSHSLCKQSPS